MWEENDRGCSVIRQDNRDRPPCIDPNLHDRCHRVYVWCAGGGAVRRVVTSMICAVESKRNLNPVYLSIDVLAVAEFRLIGTVGIQEIER